MARIDRLMRFSVATCARVTYALRQEWYLWRWVKCDAKTKMYRDKFRSS